MTKKQKQFLTGKLSQFILREQGKGFGMSGWLRNEEPGYIVNRDNIARPVPACGTVACIGGSVQHLLGCFPQDDVIVIELGLTWEKASGLFYGWEVPSRGEYGWPQKFKTRYAKAKTTLGKAKVAVALLKEVARTNGKCLGPHKVK